MKKLLLISSLLLVLVNLQAQFNCNMPEDTLFYLKSATDCGEILSYSLDPYPSHTPIKTLRIAFDIIQRSDGSGNFNGGNAHIISELERLIDSSNFRLSNIQIHNPSATGPHIPNSKIKLLLNDVFFYTNTDLYNYALQDDHRTVADSFYFNVMQNRSDLSIIDKEHTLHVILLPPNESTRCCAGQASWFADKKWILMKGYDYAFNWGDEPVKEVVAHFIHEVGHSLGLEHNFKNGPNGTQCDDCADNGCPTEGSSNNYMDYTIPSSIRVSFSDCQISKVHYCLMGKKGNIEDCFVQDYCYNSQAPISITSGQNITWNSSKNLRGNLNIENNATLNISCEISIPANGFVTVNYGGKLIIDEGIFKNSCDIGWNGIEVKNGGYLEINATYISDYDITVKSGGTIRIVDDINIQGNNQIHIESGGYICIDNSASIVLQDYYSVINLYTGFLSGVNQSVITNPGTCQSNPESAYITGSGSICTFTEDVYIQNETISSDRYITGRNIFVGPNVNISNNAKVIFDAENEVSINDVFNVNLGTEFEIK